MSQKIRTWQELMHSSCRATLDEFCQGKPYVMIWPSMDNRQVLHLGSAIKAAQQVPTEDVQFLSQPAPNVDDVRIPVHYGRLGHNTTKVVDWETQVNLPFAGNLGLVDSKDEVIIQICVPLGSLGELELVPIF